MSNKRLRGLFSNLSPLPPSLVREGGIISKRGGYPLDIISSLSPSEGERDKRVRDC